MVTFGEAVKPPDGTLARPTPPAGEHPLQLSASDHSKIADHSDKDAFNYREFKIGGDTSTRSLNLNGAPIISPETSSKALTVTGPLSPNKPASTPQDERPHSTKGEIVIHDDPYTVAGSHPLRRRPDHARSQTTAEPPSK